MNEQLLKSIARKIYDHIKDVDTKFIWQYFQTKNRRTAVKFAVHHDKYRGVSFFRLHCLDCKTAEYFTFISNDSNSIRDKHNKRLFCADLSEQYFRKDFEIKSISKPKILKEELKAKYIAKYKICS